MSTGIHEDASADAARGNLVGNSHAGQKTADTAGSAFDSAGGIGKQFTTEGAIGGAAQKIGGPFDAKGAVGKQFTEGGSIGGKVQEMMGDQKK